MRGVRRRAAERVGHPPIGETFHADDTPRVLVRNCLHLDASVPPTVRAEQVVEVLEERFHDVPHRHVIAEDEEAGARLAPGLRRAGFTSSREVWLVQDHRSPTPPGPEHPAAWVSEERVRALEALTDRETMPSATVKLLEELARGRHALGSSTRGTRYLVAGTEELDATHATLYEVEGLAQIDDVATVEEHRRQGFGTAAIELAVDMALDGLTRRVFLSADADGRARRLYEGLGFQPVGITWSFTRTAR